MLKRILPMALVSALCVGLAIYVTAPKAPAGGEGATGTYSASAEGFQSQVTVTATFDKGTITDVVLDVSGETAGFGADAGDTLVENIKATNGVDFDGKSGATVTSEAVRTAMADILAQASAGGGAASYTATATGYQSDVTVTVTFDGDTITDVVLDVSGETPGIGADAGDTLVENIKATNGVDFDGKSGATVTSEAVKTAMADILAQASAGGGGATYTATAEGFQSDVTLTVTFDGDTITDVVLDVSGETEGFGADIGDTLAENIKAAGNDQFDGVSGVTYTSDAARAAMADILSQKG